MSNYWIGFGCKKNTSLMVIETGINQLLTQANLSLTAIMGIATIDRKLQEPALITYSDRYNLQLIGFNSSQLATIIPPNPSTTIHHLVNTYSVAESAALLAANTDQLIIPKQTFKLPNHQGIITLALTKRTIGICTCCG